MTPLDLDWYAARLAVAIYDTNAEYRMGVHDLREGLKHIPGGKNLTMRYESNGDQVFIVGGEEVCFAGNRSVSAGDIEIALSLSKKKL